MLLSEPARARGIRLEGYGVLFDIDVPSLQSASLWSLQTLDQNNVGLESAINALRSAVNSSGDPTLQQALQRVELNVAPLPTVLGTSTAQATASSQPRALSGSAASTTDVVGTAPVDTRSSSNPYWKPIEPKSRMRSWKRCSITAGAWPSA